MSFEERVEKAKKYLTDTEGLVMLENLDKFELEISDRELDETHDNIVHVELEDMSEVCGARKWVTIAVGSRPTN